MAHANFAVDALLQRLDNKIEAMADGQDSQDFVTLMMLRNTVRVSKPSIQCFSVEFQYRHGLQAM